MDTYKHPLVKKAFQFVDLYKKIGISDPDLFIILEFAVWLSKQVDMPDFEQLDFKIPLEVNNYINKHSVRN